MQRITGQLVRVRRLARTLLVVQRLAQALALALAALLVLGALDFALRLPGLMRGTLMTVLLSGLVVWLGARLVRAFRFGPSLTDLALRAERLFPELRGRLASAVEFTSQAGAYGEPARTAALAEASRSGVATGLEPGALRRLLAPKRTLVFVAMAAGLAALTGATFAVAPESSRIAAERWLTPWSAVQWPKRTAVVSLTHEPAWPADTPLALRSAVERGHHEGMRVWVRYRLIDAEGEAGAWQRVLMNEQQATAAGGASFGAEAAAMPAGGGAAMGGEAAAGEAPRFERLVELADRAPPADAQGTRGAVEYYFEAGDDRTEPQRLALIERPAVTAVSVSIEPPPYARGLVETRTSDLHVRSDRRPTARGLAGSRVALRLGFNKPVPVTAADLPRVVPGLAGLAEDAVRFEVEAESAGPSAGEEAVRAVTLSFPLRERIETSIELEDAHGFTNLSERRYAIEALADEPAGASLLEPERDRSVMPEAEVAVEALVQDDVGVERVSILAEVPAGAVSGGERAGAGDEAGEAEEAAEAPTTTLTLAERTGRQPRLRVAETFDLAELALSPGDTVTLVAEGQDVFELDGERHEPVHSAPRRLRIIDAATLTRQLRSELAGVRQQAVRLEGRQRQLLEEPAREAEAQQGRLGRQIEAQRGLVERLMARAERNRLDEPALDELMEQADRFLAEAGEASDAAAGALEAAEAAREAEAEPQAIEAHERQAEGEQEAVRTALNDLVSLLDQGQDAMALQLELRRLRTDQRNLEAQTSELLPQTAGSALEDLPEALREQLRELAERQAAAAEQMDELLGEMQSTAEALSQMEDERSEAAAEALAEATALAEREALDERMADSSEAIDQNRLSQAGQAQAESLDVMERMLEEMGEHERRMQAMLVRRLQELAERLEQLIERQGRELARLEPEPEPEAGEGEAAALGALAEGQMELRQATMAAADMARGSEQTAPVAKPIERAVTAQGEAVRALRADDRGAARAEEETALAALEAALEAVREQREQAEEEAADAARRELQAAYEDLAQRQANVREQVLEQAGDGDELNRRQRAGLMGLAQEEAEIRAAAAELREEVEDSLLFEYLHGRVDTLAERAVELLRRAEQPMAVARAQQRVADDLRRMAAVLDPDSDEADFAGAQGGDGGDGGGGGGGEEPSLVPPLAELRLLRTLQEAALTETRALDEQPAAESRGERLEALSDEQRELAELGERLIEQMEQQMQPQMQPEGGGPPR